MRQRYQLSQASLTQALLLPLIFLTACSSAGAGDGGLPDGTLSPPEATPPPQALLLPGDPTEGELEEDETDRWIFGAAAGQLATVEIWFRPTSTSGPEAQMNALLVGPEGVLISQETGTVTLPPYVVEQELPDTGSYLLRLDSLSGTPGRYTVLVTISNERLLTRPEVYTSTLPLLAISPQEGTGGSGSWGFVWPAPRRAISGWYFHDPENPGHAGLDIAAALYDPLYAAASGTVSFAGSSGGYGNLVVIDHSDGWQSWYGHLSLLYVTEGQEVGQGEAIGAAGSTGFSSGPHLHFELRLEGNPMDPLVYLQ